MKKFTLLLIIFCNAIVTTPCKYPFSRMHKIFKRHVKKDQLHSDYPTIPIGDHNLVKIWLHLHKKLHMHRIIPLFYAVFSKSSVAEYDDIQKSVTIFPCFFAQNETPSRQLAILIHELRHTQQDQKKFRYPQKIQDLRLKKAQKDEKDADLKVAQELTCPLCLKMFQIMQNKKQDKDGYALRSEIEPYIKQSSMKYLCNAHKKANPKKYFKKLTRQQEERLREYDKKLGDITTRKQKKKRK